jgi:hypothetical protein
MDTLCNSCVILDSKHRNGTGEKNQIAPSLFHRICRAPYGPIDGRSRANNCGRQPVRKIRVYGGAGRNAGKHAVGYFGAMTAGTSISRRSAKLGPELVQKKGKPRAGLGNLLLKDWSCGVLIRLFQPLIELEHPSGNVIVICA